MERKPVLVGLKNGRVTALSIDTSDEERLSFIENGCDSVILMPENSDMPDFKAEYEIKFVDKATLEGFVLVPREPTQDMMIAALAVISTGIGKDHIDVENYPVLEKNDRSTGAKS